MSSAMADSLQPNDFSDGPSQMGSALRLRSRWLMIFRSFAGMAFGAESTGSAIRSRLGSSVEWRRPGRGERTEVGKARKILESRRPLEKASQWRSILTRIRQPIGGRSLPRPIVGNNRAPCKGSRSQALESGAPDPERGAKTLQPSSTLCPAHDDSGWWSPRRRERYWDGFFRQAARHSFRNHGHQRRRWSGQGELPENPTVEAQLGGGRPAKNPAGLPPASSCRISSEDR